MKQLSREMHEVIASNNGLQRYLVSLTEDVPYTKRSWLYENIDNADDILKLWMKQLNRLSVGDTFEREVFQFDTSQIEKWGPQGGHPPVSEALEDVILPTFKEPSLRFSLSNSAEWKLSIRSCIKEMHSAGVQGLRPASYKNVVDDMRARDTLESNSGWPLFTRRNKPEVVKASIADASSGKYIDYPAILLFRRYNGKLRMVWMFPMATNIVEGAYFQPIQSRIVKSNLPYFAPWQGFESVRDLITRAYDSGKFVAASDFSATDEHFRLSCTLNVAEVLASVVTRGNADGLYNSLRHMHNIPLVIGPNEMLVGEHGVSSGSNWTNFIETIFDMCFAKFVSLNTKYTGLCAIGDDMAWVSNTYDESFNDRLAVLAAKAGQETKADKTNNYPDKVKFLQRLFQRGYKRPDGKVRAVYSTIRALKSSVYPERFHNPKQWSSDMFCARQFMILENCVDHPLFGDFVKFICRGSRYLVPFARKSERELNEITRQSKLIPGLNPTYNQERRDSSLAMFESIRLARTL